MELADLTRGMRKNDFLEPDFQACAKKNIFSELDKLIFCKASVFFKLLKKTIFQVPKSTHILILCGLEAVQACAKKKNEPEKLFFCKTRLHPMRPYKGSCRKKKKRKGELQTSRIRSNLRIWQSYSRVPQILKVLCV